MVDPYGDYAELPPHSQCTGRAHFARAPGTDVWIESADLPEATHKRLCEIHSSRVALSRQSLQFRIAAATCDRRKYADATIVAQGTAARGDRRPHCGGGRARRARYHCALGGLLRTRTWNVVRSRAHEGDRPRTRDLSG